MEERKFGEVTKQVAHAGHGAAWSACWQGASRPPCWRWPRSGQAVTAAEVGEEVFGYMQRV